MKTTITYIRLVNQIHETEITLQIRKPFDEQGRYQLSKGQLQKARRTLCPDPACRKAGCGRDGAGQRGSFLYWLVSAEGMVEKNTYPGDDQLELSVLVPCQGVPAYTREQITIMVGPIMTMIASPQAQALHHATRWASKQLSRKLAALAAEKAEQGK
jgi:hypothetical protein